MDALDRHDRTVRLLEAKLEALARAAERPLARRRSLEDEMLRAAVATHRAIALELLSSQEAREIWTTVARRHPNAPWSRRTFDLAA